VTSLIIKTYPYKKGHYTNNHLKKLFTSIPDIKKSSFKEKRKGVNFLLAKN
jgi:hypothetical protein